MNPELEEVCRYAVERGVDIDNASEQYGEQHAINPQKALERTKRYIDDVLVNKEVIQK